MGEGYLTWYRVGAIWRVDGALRVLGDQAIVRAEGLFIRQGVDAWQHCCSAGIFKKVSYISYVTPVD